MPRISISSLLNKLTLEPNPLKSAPRDSPLVIFTPFLRRPPPHVDPAARTDPFERFVRRFAAHRPRVRHVPYVARVGMSAEHRRHIHEAGGVVVVMCEPEAIADPDTAARQIDGVMFQLAFARDAAFQLLQHSKPSMLVAVNIHEYYNPVPYTAVLDLADWGELEKAVGIICEDLGALGTGQAE
jgi:hypothetical protein